MGESSIQWTDFTWNPWQGCAKVSAGCDQCYMFRDKIRYGQDPNVIVRSKPPTFNAPLRWERDAVVLGSEAAPIRVFTCSWSDFFIREADPWRAEAWDIIRRTPHLTYQVLTKRPARILANLPSDWGSGYPNVWLGVSVESQETANARIPLLLAAPACVRFLSCEPLLGPLDLTDVTYAGLGRNALTVDDSAFGRERHVDWVIVGGESGGLNARGMSERWARNIVSQCRRAEVAVFVKQLGSVWARAARARDLHGGDMAEWPADLRVREFPVPLSTPSTTEF